MTIRLAHLSDIHFGGENAAGRGRPRPRCSTPGDFDLVVVTGDLTRFAEIEEFEAAAAWLAKIRGAEAGDAGQPRRALPRLGRADLRALPPLRALDRPGAGPDPPGRRLRGARPEHRARRPAPAQLVQGPDLRAARWPPPSSWFEELARRVRPHRRLPPSADRDDRRPDDRARLGRRRPRRGTSPRPASTWCCRATSTRPSPGPTRSATGRPMRWARARCRSASGRRAAELQCGGHRRGGDSHRRPGVDGLALSSPIALGLWTVAARLIR